MKVRVFYVASEFKQVPLVWLALRRLRKTYVKILGEWLREKFNLDVEFEVLWLFRRDPFEEWNHKAFPESNPDVDLFMFLLNQHISGRNGMFLSPYKVIGINRATKTFFFTWDYLFHVTSHELLHFVLKDPKTPDEYFFDVEVFRGYTFQKYPFKSK